MNTSSDQHNLGESAAWRQSAHPFLRPGGLFSGLERGPAGQYSKPASDSFSNERTLVARLGNALIYRIAQSVVALIQALPLREAARLGRACGGMAFYLTARYRRVAVENLTHAFPEKGMPEIREIAQEHFRRVGENYVSAIKTAVMSPEEMQLHLEFSGTGNIRGFQLDSGAQHRIVAIGHFGNFELYARVNQFIPGYRVATTYRGLNQSGLNRLLLELRSASGCHFYERRTEAAELQAAMRKPGMLLGLLADQYAGAGGVNVPFFGRECSTSAAPAVFALRYNSPLNTAICYRIGLARWRIEVGEEIPTCIDGKPRSISDITVDVNRAFETAIRRDPANWFWVHRRWRSAVSKVNGGMAG